MRMDELSNLIKGNPSSQPQDYERIAGKTLLDHVISNVVTNGFNGGAANSINGIRETLGVAKDLAGIQEGKEKRLVEELSELREQNKVLHEAKVNTGMSDVAKMLEVLIPIIKGEGSTKDEMWTMQMERADQHHKEMMELIKDTMGKKNDDDVIKKIGMDAILSKLSSDPRDEFDRQREYWYKIYKSEHSNNENIISFEKWKAQKHVDLEEKKIDLDIKKQEREDARLERAEERQNRMIENLALAVTGMASKGNSTQEEINHALNAGMVFVKCPNCNDEFVLTQAKDHISCPFCKAELDIGQQPA